MRSLVLVVLGIIVAGSIAAVVSAFYFRAGEVDEAPPSACATAQNSTTTCEFYEQLGSSIGGVNALDDCCRGCDELDGCQGWIFDGATTMCRWIKFTEQPCATTPDKASCRCMTHSGIVFGYRPTRKIVA